MRRGIYALVHSLVHVYEGGPAVALSLGIVWLFLATSCGLTVVGETDNPLVNALPALLFGVSGLLFLTALVKYLRRGRGRFYQMLSDERVIVALEHQLPEGPSVMPGRAHLLPLKLYYAPHDYDSGGSTRKATGTAICPECAQEATFLIDGLKPERIPDWGKLLVGAVLLALGLWLGIALSSVMWSAAPAQVVLMRLGSLLLLLLSMLCFLSVIRLVEVRRLRLPAGHQLARLTLADAQEVR